MTNGGNMSALSSVVGADYTYSSNKNSKNLASLKICGT